jgi:hypothetical protein
MWMQHLLELLQSCFFSHFGDADDIEEAAGDSLRIAATRVTEGARTARGLFLILGCEHRSWPLGCVGRIELEKKNNSTSGCDLLSHTSNWTDEDCDHCTKLFMGLWKI